MNVFDTLKKIAADLAAAITGKPEALEEDVSEAKDFVVDAAEYAAANIKPAVFKGVSDAMTAAESAFAADPSLDKAEFAFGNAVAALTTDGISFVESDINYAIETVIQQRNMRLAAAQPGDTTKTS